jgi:hypothetical protein
MPSISGLRGGYACAGETSSCGMGAIQDASMKSGKKSDMPEAGPRPSRSFACAFRRLWTASTADLTAGSRALRTRIRYRFSNYIAVTCALLLNSFPRLTQWPVRRSALISPRLHPHENKIRTDSRRVSRLMARSSYVLPSSAALFAHGAPQCAPISSLTISQSPTS